MLTTSSTTRATGKDSEIGTTSKAYATRATVEKRRGNCTKIAPEKLAACRRWGGRLGRPGASLSRCAWHPCRPPPPGKVSAGPSGNRAPPHAGDKLPTGDAAGTGGDEPGAVAAGAGGAGGCWWCWRCWRCWWWLARDGLAVMAGGGSPREKMTYPACSPALCRDCGRPSCKSPRSLYGRGVGECAGAAGDRGCDFGAHDMNRSGDAACRRSCLQQPETLVRGLGPHRQDRLRILHPITYVIAILCFHGAARDWRQADTMQAEGARSDGGRCAGGGSAGRDVGGRGERGGGRG